MPCPHPRSGSAYAGLSIGLLGGAFNPAHAGHREISLFAMKRLGLHQIWWLASPRHPLKASQGIAALPERLAKARAVAGPMHIAVTAMEAALGTRYTVDTLKELRRRFPRTRFVWLMGADNLGQMSLWRDWPEIFRQVPVAVFRRPAYACGRGAGRAARRFRKACRPVGQAGRLARTQPPAWTILDNRLNALSATALRKAGNAARRKR